MRKNQPDRKEMVLLKRGRGYQLRAYVDKTGIRLVNFELYKEVTSDQKIKCFWFTDPVSGATIPKTAFSKLRILLGEASLNDADGGTK